MAEYEDVPADARNATLAHLLSTVSYNVAHVLRHGAAAAAADSAASKDFNIRHLNSHARDALEHIQHAEWVLREYFPAAGAELDALNEAAGLGQQPAARGYGDGSDASWQREMATWRR